MSRPASKLPSIVPLLRTRLPNDLAERIKGLIQRDGYGPGDRLPSIAALARDFEVGAPTVREALKRLEMVGTVTIRHGSGVYVGREDDSLLMTNPVFSGMPFTPVTSISPDIAWMTVSKAARPGYSESAPKPEIEQ